MTKKPGWLCVVALWLAAVMLLGSGCSKQAKKERHLRKAEHYFGTKAELMHAALVRIGERVVKRGLQRIAEAGPEPSPQAVLRAVLNAALPHDEESRLDMVLFLTFYIAGFTDPTLANAATLTVPMSVMGVFTELLRDAQRNGQLRPGVDPDVEGAMLLAAVPGLGLSLAAGTTTIDEISVAVDRTLDRLFIHTPPKRPTKKSARTSRGQRSTAPRVT